MNPSPDPDYARPFRGAVWTDVLERSRACPQIPDEVLLHAGPPYRGAAPAPVLQAAMQALLYEGVAADERAAARLLGDGSFRLEPAQDHGVVTPLAQVVSASMPLLQVTCRGASVYAALVEGPAPALRFGSLNPACRAALRDLFRWVAALIAPIVRQRPIDIGDLVAAATAQGDECHARVGVAQETLQRRLALPAVEARRLDANPAFVLPLLMAGAAAALRASGGRVTGMGGNGVDFGLRLGGPGPWVQVPGQAPAGPRLPGHESTVALAAIGDSAVIDYCGLGGQALAAAPDLASEWQVFLPADAAQRREAIVDPDTGLLDPQRIALLGLSPLINLALLDRSGTAGLIGRGVYAAPLEVFGAACAT